MEKAQIATEDGGQKITVMYNPNELTLGKSLNVSGEGSRVQFQRLASDNFTVSLFFDTYEKKTDVRLELNQIEALMKPTQGTGPRKEPPVVMFSWSKIWFKGIITAFQQSFTMFLANGTPVRARASVTFKSVLTPEEELESLGYFNCRRIWRVTEGDRLDIIAEKALGDPNMWRLIAETNGIYDPLTFPTNEQTGQILVIPDIHKPAKPIQYQNSPNE